MNNFKHTDQITNNLLELYKINKYTLFTGPYNPNIFGVRNKSNISNSFDDQLGILYQDIDCRWNCMIAKGTTDPGTYWLKNPSKLEGTAILVPGQYKGAFGFGKHKGQYDCLVQIKSVKVYRDNNKNSILDYVNSSSTFSGIQIHRSNSSKESTIVDKWSAGCQVFADPSDFSEFMSFLYNSKSIYGDTFTYTLFEES